MVMALDNNEFKRISLLAPDGTERHLVPVDDNPAINGKAAPLGSLALGANKLWHKATAGDTGWQEIDIP